MKLPNYQKAEIDKNKITGYLLSFTHRDGRSKAKFFSQLGFTLNNWQEFATAIKQHILNNEVIKMESSVFGIRYIIEGELKTPVGKSPIIRSVWFIEKGDTIPRFVTAYPIRRNIK